MEYWLRTLGFMEFFANSSHQKVKKMKLIKNRKNTKKYRQKPLGFRTNIYVGNPNVFCLYFFVFFRFLIHFIFLNFLMIVVLQKKKLRETPGVAVYIFMN